MKIQTEKDMNKVCNHVNNIGKPFDIEIKRTLSPKETQKYLVEILGSESSDKVNNYSTGNQLKGLFIQGINDISYHQNTHTIKIDEIPRIYPSGNHKNLEGAMTGVLVNAYDEQNDCFLFHMRGKNVSTPFGFQGAAAGFGDFGEHLYETAKDELNVESGISNPISLEKKALAILPFMKGNYPQPLFVYGFNIDSNDLQVIESINDVEGFEASVKKEINEGAKMQEGYPFLVPSNKVNTFVNAIYERDASQTGKDGGFFGPIKDSHDIFNKYLKKN